jgi:hypothetical protein
MDNAFVAVVPTRPCPLFGRPVHRRDGSHRFRPGASPQALQIPPRGHPALLDFPRGQRGITPAFGYGAPHPSTSETSTHLSTSLPSAHYRPLRHPLVVPPTSRCLRLYGFVSPPISQRDEEGFSSCFGHPCHRAVAITPPECLAASVSLRQSMLPSPHEGRLGLWGSRFEAISACSLSLRPDDSLTIRKMALSIGFQDSVPFLLAIQATGLWLLPW